MLMHCDGPGAADLLKCPYCDSTQPAQVKASMDNVAGVKIPKFEQFTEGVDTKMALTGLGAGGKAIQVRLGPPCSSKQSPDVTTHL